MSAAAARLAPLMSSVHMGWETPESILRLVRAAFGTEIALDPCSTTANPTRADRFYTPETDGLARPWWGPAFVNPPYGRELGKWCQRMADFGENVEIIGLIPARPDTRAWHKWITTADAICFWRGRIKFVGAPAPAPFPSALPYWGNRPREFVRAFAPHGWIVGGSANQAEPEASDK